MPLSYARADPDALHPNHAYYNLGEYDPPRSVRPGAKALIGRAAGVMLLMAGDATAASGAPHLADLLVGPAPTLTTAPGSMVAFGAITVASLLLAGLYGRGPAGAPHRHAGRIMRALIAANVIILLRFALLRASPATLPLTASIVWAATGFGIACVAILALRAVIALWWRRLDAPAVSTATALVMTGHCDRDLRQRLDRLAGVRLGTMFAWGMPQGAGLRMIADAATFTAMIRAGMIDDILVFTRRTDDAAARRRIDALLAGLADQPVRVRLAFDAVAEIGAGGVARGQSLRMVTVLDRPITTIGAVCKRGFDVVGSALLLLAFGPLMAVIAVLLWLTGPVLFRQIRVGQDGGRFTVLKFRTMHEVGHEVGHQVGRAGGLAPCATEQASRHDRRITRIGAVLRRLSLDELPQLFNVLCGDMSLVGPRPHAPRTDAGGFTFEQAIAFYGVRHRVKPGLTGLAQVRGLRGPTAHPEIVAARVAADLDYIERWSPWLDLAILLRTIPAVIGGRNAF